MERLFVRSALRRDCCRAIAIVSLCAGMVLAVRDHQSSATVASIISSQPLATCFAKGTDPAYVAQMEQKLKALWSEQQVGIDGQRQSQYQLGSRWSGGQGNPRSLTWSFVPDGLSISSGIGEGVGPSTLFSIMDTKFASQGGRATWINRFQQVFDRWSALTGITYTRITVGGNDWDDGASWGSAGAANLRGDIRICAKQIDNASNVLAYNYFPNSGGDMVLDEDENWGSSSNQNRFMRNVVTHEHGHGIGMTHVCPANSTKLMEPFLNTSFDGPRHDEIRGSQRHYGDVFESDNSTATANDLGALTSGVPLSTTCDVPPPLTGINSSNTSNCTIDADGEQDYFLFTTTSPSLVSATVTPKGLSYADYPEDSTCNNNTANTNSLTIANLAVQLIDTDQTTVLATADTQAAGVAESFSNILVPAGSYYLRIYETASATQSQMYTFSVTSASTQCAVNGDCNNGTFCDGVETCSALGVCQSGSYPCGSQLCRESDDTCVNCLVNFDCANGAFCDGVETCDGAGNCQAGGYPCGSQLCREFDDQCVNCLSASDCDNGTFCDGAESCDGAGNCQVGSNPCVGLFCREFDDQCVECLTNAHCDNGDSCDGLEFCEVDGTCQAGTITDCNGNLLDDACDISNQTSEDCNENTVPDECDIASGTSRDRFPRGGDGVPDECQIKISPIGGIIEAGNISPAPPP